MEIKIRRALKEDCPRLLELIHELAVYEKAPDEVTVSLEHFEESGFGVNPAWWAFVASSLPDRQAGPNPFSIPKAIGREGEFSSPSPPEEGRGEAILGFALFYIRYSTWKGQRMYLEDILVTEKARRMGIGKLLVNRLIEEARDKKLNGIVLQVLEWNEPAINFYKKYNGSFDGEWVNCIIPVS